MKLDVLSAGAAVLLFALAVLSVGAQTGNGSFSFTTGGSTRTPGIEPDRLSGGKEPVEASGRVVTETFDFRGFGTLEISHAFEVEVIRSSSYRVEVRIHENLLNDLRVEKRGEALLIGLKPRRSTFRNATMEAEVHMPDLRGIMASGASDVRFSGFSSAADFDVDLSGASKLDGEITAEDVRMEASGASRIRLRGRARDLRLDASGASSLDLADFPVRDADIELSGASEAEVRLSGTLDIDASGASRLYFGGSPLMGRVDLSGASSIKRR